MKEMKSKVLYTGLLIVLLLAGSACFWPKAPEIEIAIGEPWSNTLQRSAVEFTTTPDSDRILLARTNASLRLLDPQYGFVTGPAWKVLVFLNEEGHVKTIGVFLAETSMSLDKAIATATALQEQMRKRGWVPFLPKAQPPISDTAQWREHLQQSDYSSLSLWQAGNNLTTFWLHRIEDSAPGLDGRYVLSLHIDPAPEVR